MTKQRKRTAGALLAAALLLIPGAITITPGTSHAAGIVPDTIRVALYIQHDKYKNTVPTAAVSSPKGLRFGDRAQAAPDLWFTVSGVQETRVSADTFRIRWLESADLSKAKALQQTLASSQSSVYMFKSLAGGQTVYRVVSGSYPTNEAAAQALALLAKSPALSAYAATASVGGSFRANAGTFPSKADAVKRQSELGTAGILSDIAAHENTAGVTVYSVWIGSEADEAALNVLMQKPEYKSLNLTPASNASDYLLMRDDVTASTDGQTAVSHFSFNPNGQKVWVSPVEGKITVKEKQRTYRGSVEFSQYNGLLAVVNELPLEEYLYSVVTGELGSGFPMEAQKAQAIAARNYTVRAGVKYGIANLTDTTLDQVYTGREAPDVIAAVDATAGELLTIGGKPAEVFFYANAGGRTADGTEVWGNAVSYMKPVDSPDTWPQRNKPEWLRVIRQNGTSGYVHPDYVKATSYRSLAGLPMYEALETVNLRTVPIADDAVSPVLGQIAAGERVTVIGKSIESNKYAWLRLFTPDQLIPSFNRYLTAPVSSLRTVEVNRRGPSGRVTGIKVNGTDFTMRYPDSFRTMFGGLNSTLFEIEETGRYTILGANGTKSERPASTGTPYLLTAAGTKTAMGKEMLLMNGAGQVRVATRDPQFLITGKGWGHGLGLSQHGAIVLAEQGKSYRDILTHYFQGTTITKY